jgi:hypothetical protein
VGTSAAALTARLPELSSKSTADQLLFVHLLVLQEILFALVPQRCTGFAFFRTPSEQLSVGVGLGLGLNVVTTLQVCEMRSAGV